MNTKVDFDLYFNTNSPNIFEESKMIIQPDKNELYAELKRDVLILCKKIEKLDMSKIPEAFKNYLIENLTVTIYNKNKHSPVWYLNEKDSFCYASPEIIKNMWINFKLTRIWMSKLEEDGFLIIE